MILQAAYVLPFTGPDPVLSPGYVRVEGDRIAEVSQGRPAADDSACIDLGRAAIMPGLIDCHCHLELSLLSRRIRFGGSLPNWLMQIGLRRPKRAATHRRAVQAGANHALSRGNTTVADISASNRSWQYLRNVPIRKVCFAEVLGIGKKRPDAIRKLLKRLDPLIEAADGENLIVGISPHAPYSTASQVYRQALDLARRHGWPLTTHLAEAKEELRFLAHGAGRWRTVLKIMGVWDESIEIPHASPIEWAKSVGLLHYPTIIAHANYLTDHDIELLGRSKCSVAYCPQAHRYFRHPPHRYQELLAAGANVVFGSDSLACSSSLGILDQVRSLWRQGTDLSPQQLLTMATVNAAAALNLHHLTGTLEKSKKADLICIEVSHRNDDPITDVIRTRADPKLVMVNGQIVKRI